MPRFPKSSRGTIFPTQRLRVLDLERILKILPKHRNARQIKTIGFTFLFLILVKYYHWQYEQIFKLRHASQVNTKPCALLFFGLIKDSFQTITLPSIQEHILAPNSQCDVFLHTYNLTTVPLNERNAEVSEKIVNISQAYLLTDNVVMEDMDSFDEKRNAILKQTRKYYYRGWGDCCISHDNMIKQWNSIQGVWDLMEHYGQSKGKSRIGKNHSKFYDQVGLFRTDVYYTKAIDIFDSRAAIPDFSHFGGYNDRLFYGSYENAEVWASKRFEFTNIFEKKYMIPTTRVKNSGYHSEFFLKNLMNHYQVPVELKRHCVWRVRAGSKIQALDCKEMLEFSTPEKIEAYTPNKTRSGDSWSLVLK